MRRRVSNRQTNTCKTFLYIFLFSIAKSHFYFQSEIAALIADRSKEVYIDVYPELFTSATSKNSNIQGTELFLPNQPSSSYKRASKNVSNPTHGTLLPTRNGTRLKERPSLSAFRTNSFAQFSQKMRKSNSTYGSTSAGSSINNSLASTKLLPSITYRSTSVGSSINNSLASTKLLPCNDSNQYDDNRQENKGSVGLSKEINHSGSIDTTKSKCSKEEEYVWRTRNSEFLDSMEECSQMKRRRSLSSPAEEHELKFIHTMQAFDEIENHADCDKGAETDIISALPIKRMSVASLADSLANAELNGEKEGKREHSTIREDPVKFSFVSRRSTRMSLTFRQSCCMSFIEGISDYEDDEDDDDTIPIQTQEGQTKTNANVSHAQLPQRKSHYIPDVFASKRDKRRSSIIESSKDFLVACYGKGAEEKLVKHTKRRSVVLNNFLAPASYKELLNAMHSPTSHNESV